MTEMIYPNDIPSLAVRELQFGKLIIAQVDIPSLAVKERPEDSQMLPCLRYTLTCSEGTCFNLLIYSKSVDIPSLAVREHFSFFAFFFPIRYTLTCSEGTRLQPTLKKLKAIYPHLQ